MSREIAQFQGALVQRLPQIEAVLPANMGGKRFCRIATGLVERNPALQNTTPASFALAVLGIAELGLEPTLGMVYVIPYKTTATLQIGYQGMIQLARNSGDVLDIYAEVVREGDEFDVTYGTQRSLTHRKTAPKDAPFTHVYAVAKLRGTDPAFVVLDREDVKKRQKVSKTGGSPSSPWAQWPEEMWRKTTVRALFKMLPKSTEMNRAAIMDDDGAMGRQTQVIDVEAKPAPKPWDGPEPTENDDFIFEDGDDPDEPPHEKPEPEPETKKRGLV